VRVDRTRRQFEVLIAHAAWNPGRAKVRFTAGVGLWDRASGHYLLPAANADATTPGGTGPARVALFDMAFRLAEPAPDWSHMGLALTLADAAAVEQADQHCFWRDCQQAAALRTGDVGPLHADIDFAKLAQGVTDTSHIPRSGVMDRIFASHFAFGQGVDFTSSCGRFPVKCNGMFVGNLQPYAVYVPAKPAPPTGWSLTLLLHASTANYNEYAGSRHQTEFGDRGRGSIVVTPLARDPDGDYTDATEADVFEVWADVAGRYHLHPGRNVISGYSMGGGGTYKLIERWPDLFARGFAAAAAPFDGGFQSQWLRSMRNVPLLTWIGIADEGTSLDNQQSAIAALEKYGFRFSFYQFLLSDHLTIATNDEYGAAARFLGDHIATADPRRVSFAMDRRADFARVGDVADHAYWLSGLTIRSPASNPAAFIDAWSQGLGLAEPTVSPPTTSPGVLLGGYHGPMPYVETTQEWTTRRANAADRLTIQAENLGTVTIDAARAHIDCNATLRVLTDGRLRVSVPSCHVALWVGKGTTTLNLRRSVR
jgi:dienelactone hydrolase